MQLPSSLGRLGRRLHRLPVSSARLLTSARGIAFWTAIALPFGYLPLFTVEAVQPSLETFVILFVLNAVALVVGHPYHR